MGRVKSITLCCRLSGAREVAKNLPRAEGYVNKLINSLPQIIFEGDVDLALELYNEHFLKQREDDDSCLYDDAPLTVIDC